MHLFASVAFHDWNLKDASDMLMLGNFMAIVRILKTCTWWIFHSNLPFVSALELGKWQFCIFTCKCIPWIHVGQFVNVSQVWLVVNWGLEPFPKQLPVQSSFLSSRDPYSWDADSTHHRHSKHLCKMATLKSNKVPSILDAICTSSPIPSIAYINIEPLQLLF